MRQGVGGLWVAKSKPRWVIRVIGSSAKTHPPLYGSFGTTGVGGELGLRRLTFTSRIRPQTFSQLLPEPPFLCHCDHYLPSCFFCLEYSFILIGPPLPNSWDPFCVRVKALFFFSWKPLLALRRGHCLGFPLPGSPAMCITTANTCLCSCRFNIYRQSLITNSVSYFWFYL